MPGRDRRLAPACRRRIADLLEAGDRPLFSFEFFPPKDEIQQRQLWQTVRELESLGPDFVSVTYGASGSTRDRTIKATEAIAHAHHAAGRWRILPARARVVINCAG